MLDKTTGIIPNLLIKAKLMAWLETKDPNTRYFYMDTKNCLYAQYLKENLVEDFNVGGYTVTTKEHVYDLPHGWAEVADNNTRTFGEALSLARLLPEA